MLAAAGVLRILEFGNREKAEIKIKDQKILAEVAKTPEKRAKGLSGRDALADNQGMIFIFREASRPSFWMQGMKLPLDFIWIYGNEVRDISPNVPADYPGLLRPREDVDKVLEVNAGFIYKYGVAVGDRIDIDSAR